MKVEELENIGKDAIRSLRHLLDKVPGNEAIAVQQKMHRYLLALHTVARGLEVRADQLGQQLQKILNHQEALRKAGLLNHRQDLRNIVKENPDTPL
jgi:hypothetical protein